MDLCSEAARGRDFPILTAARELARPKAREKSHPRQRHSHRLMVFLFNWFLLLLRRPPAREFGYQSEKNRLRNGSISSFSSGTFDHFLVGPSTSCFSVRVAKGLLV